jgi:hypothetical protein
MGTPMTKKDYKAIAALLERYVNDDYVPFAVLVDGLCEVLSGDNPAFDCKRFKEAIYGN